MKDRILNILNEQDKAYTILELKDILGLNTTEEIENLIKELNDLESKLEIYHTNKDKYMALKYSHLKKGKISVSEKGFGFVLMQDEPDIYIDKRSLNGAVDKDIVIVEIIKKRLGKKLEGRVLRIASRTYGNLVGEINFVNNEPVFTSKDHNFKQKVIITKENLKDVVDGHIVLLNVIRELDRNTILANVSTIIGHKNDPGIDIESIIYEHAFSTKFSEEVMKEVENIPSEVKSDELVGRKDFTNEVIFTIDGDDTKDIDDAISINKKENGNYELGVHIADVSYYVKPGTKLYEEAYERGTSVYLVDTVVPMLPHKLSNGICSLNPGVIRLTISCVMEIDKKGNVVSHDIYESYIKSRIQMTYKKVNKWLEENIVEEGYEPYTEKLNLMKELSDILRSNRQRKGAINFDTDEAKIIADETGHPIDVVLRERGTGQMLIEDFMIAANETIASHIYWMNLPFVYRVHGLPNEEKVNNFLNFISTLGYKITGKLNYKYPSTFQHILNQLKDKKEYKILTSLMLRAMQKAVYQPDNIGHFGLASKIYTHFTSPIRRFPDTTVHQLLRTYLFNNDQTQDTISYWKSYLPILTEHASTKERDAIECERDVEDMKMAEYMMDHIGEEYDGMISGVTSFGLFVELPNLIEGLVHISEVPGDYYIYDEKRMCLIGQKSKKIYRIGDEVKVVVKSASKEESFIDFDIKTDYGKEDEEKKKTKKVG